MGEVRQRTFKFCTVCQQEATPMCRSSRHSFEDRVRPVWSIRYYRDGRRFEESSGSTKYADAVALLKIREGDIAKGVPVSPQLARFRFEDAAADIEAEYVVNSRRSIGELTRRIELHLKPFSGGRRMSRITTADIRAFTRKRLDTGAAAAEVNRELAILKRMFTLAVKGNRLLVRPHIPMLTENNVRKGFFEREQFEAVHRHLPAPLQAVATFAYLTGWRIQSEILPLQWRQVDLRAGTARLDPGTTKNRDGRLFPYGDHLPALRQLLDAQRRVTTELETARGIICPWVFHRNGKRIRGFRKAWANACEAAGCLGMIPHDLRRTAVRNLERAGVSRSVAMQLTGHKTEAVYRRYAIVSEGDLGAGLDKLHALRRRGRNRAVRRKERVRRFRHSP
jgi:integrase